MFVLNQQYVILKKDDGVMWQEYVEIDNGTMRFEGDCHLDEENSIVFLSPWKNNSIEGQITDLKSLEQWCDSRYFALVTESGNMDVYFVDSGLPVSLDEMKRLSSVIGCTMKYK